MLLFSCILFYLCKSEVNKTFPFWKLWLLTDKANVLINSLMSFWSRKLFNNIYFHCWIIWRIHKLFLKLRLIKLGTTVNHKTYTFDEAFKASLNYFAGDELAAKVWVNKYALKDAFGNIYEKSPIDMHHRLANEIARIEKKYPNPLSEE